MDEKTMSEDIQLYKLTSHETAWAVDLLVFIFSKDEYFKDWKKEDLWQCFKNAYQYCLKEGEVWGAFSKDELIGVSMWFKYTSGDNVSSILPSEIKDIIDKECESFPIVYKLSTGILPDYRGRGVGTKLLGKMLEKNQGPFFTDISNPEWAEKLKIYGWKEISEINSCKIMKL